MRFSVKFELDHIGVAVSNLQSSIAFYQSVLELSVSWEEVLEQPGVRLAMLPMGPEARAAKLELLEAENADSPIAAFIAKFGPGLHHLAMRVDNLEGAIDQLRTKGFEIIGEPQRGAGNCRFVFMHPHSTGGVLLELLQTDHCKGN
jgi:methylmalonyl-CoA/ethylmalonyl-CoA epimerase